MTTPVETQVTAASAAPQRADTQALAELNQRSAGLEKPTLWQANRVKVGWPMGDTLLKKDCSQLWFQTSLRDVGEHREALSQEDRVHTQSS